MSRASSMSIFSLFCLTCSAHNPDININLDGKAFQSNNSRWIQMTCLSNLLTIGCTAEFLTNQKSNDHLRAVNNQCYHLGGLCAEHLCTCNDDCKQFTLNITTLGEYSTTTFGCSVIVGVDNLMYKATTEIKPVQNGFELFSKEIIPLYVNNSVQKTTTHSPSEVNSFIEKNVLVIAICTGIICTMSVIAVFVQILKFCRRNPNKGCLNGNGQNNIKLTQQQSCQNYETSEGISIIPYPPTRSHIKYLETEDDRYGIPSQMSCTEVSDDVQFDFRERVPRLDLLDEDRFSYLDLESHTDSGISSISNAKSRYMTLDAGQLSSIEEDDQQVLEKNWTAHDRSLYLNSNPSLNSRNTRSTYSSSSQETMSMFDRESNRGTSSRQNSYNMIFFNDSDT